MATEKTLIYFIAGLIGAFTKDILEDNALQMPCFKDGKFYLGCIGGAIIGGIAGVVVDNSPMVAFTAGYTGSGIITSFVLQGTKKEITEAELIEAEIMRIAKEEGVDQELALRVAKCESSLDPKAVNTNTDGNRDRGLYQINEKYHPEVTDELAFNVEYSTRFFCKAMKGGNLSWWNATRTCWEK